MVETNEELKIPVGTEEAVKLKPAVVKVSKVEIRELGDKKSKKIVFSVVHKDAPDLIQISAVKFERKGKLERAGTWWNLDSKGLIRKGSALAVLLQNQNCKTPEDLIGKEIPTVEDENGYLVFKAY